MAHWSNRSWLTSVGVSLLAVSVAGGVVGCSKKKEEDTKAKAEKAESKGKKKPQGDRYADNVKLGGALKEWSKRWSETADLPACDPLLKAPADAEVCKTAQAALTTMKAAAAKPEAEAALIHAAAELTMATENASDKLRTAFMEKTQAERKAAPAGSGAPGAKPLPSGFAKASPRTRPLGSAGRAALADKLGDKAKGLEAAPLDPDQQVLQAYSRVNRASLRYLGQFLQFGPLPTRNLAFTELEALSKKKETWPALGRSLREAAMTENDEALQAKLKALAPKLARRPPGAMPTLPGLPPGHPGKPEGAEPSPDAPPPAPKE
ncbi:MAG TPA: hypothetical protein VHP33_30985 [Polyangiaceae bacterium]|nr:hypothetical protein [Polyangiaceae bacterium]